MKRQNNAKKRFYSREIISLEDKTWILEEIAILEETLNDCTNEAKKEVLLKELEDIKKEFNLE